MKKLLISLAILVFGGVSCNSAITEKNLKYPRAMRSSTPIERFIGDMPFSIYVFQVDGHEYISDNRGGLIHKVNCGGDHPLTPR